MNTQSPGRCVDTNKQGRSLAAAGVMAGGLMLLLTQTVQAAGTASGTDITNSVTVNYKVSTVDQTALTDTATFKVDNKILPTLSVLANATVTPGESDAVVSYQLTNTGNTTQGYQVEVADSTVADDYGLTSVTRYFETGDVNTTFNGSGTETLINHTNNAFELAAGASKVIYVVGNVPLSAADTEVARYDLLVTTLDSGGNVVTTADTGAWTSGSVQVVYAEGAAGPHTDDTTNDGQVSATAAFTASSAALAITKTQAITADGFSGSNYKAIPGATVTYTISLANTGTLSATDLSVADTLPATMTFTDNTVDVADGTNTDTNITNGGTGGTTSASVAVAGQVITVSGISVAASATTTITFDATIN
jgi:uncharacterized repeat protein (TIGR01451 family)